MSRKKTTPPTTTPPTTTPPTTTPDDPFGVPTILIGDHPDLGRPIKPILAGTTIPPGTLICDGRPGPHFVAERSIAIAGGIMVIQGRFDATLGDYCGKRLAHDGGEPDDCIWMPVDGPIDPLTVIADQYADFIEKEEAR